MAIKTIVSPETLELDNTIQNITIGQYVADNGVVRSEFSELGNRVSVEQNGRRFTWTPQEMKYVDGFGMEDVIYTVQDAPLETRANYARFNRSMPDVDDWFIQENDRLKHQILVQGFQRDPLPFLTGPIDFIIGGKVEFDPDLRIFADGLEQTGEFETSGAIEFKDTSGNSIFNLPEVVAYDSRIPNRNSIGGKYRASQNGESGVLNFQFIIDNEWMSSADRVYPIVIDPTVIVSSGYDTTSVGGRKLVRLSNDWLIAIAYNSSSSGTHYVYKSVDNGATWSQLCTIAPGNVIGTSYLAGAAIASVGTVCHVVLPVSTSSWRYLYGFKFDATTQTNVNIADAGATVIDSQNITGSGISASVCIDGAGAIHAVWTVTTNSNSRNLRYAKSTNGGTSFTVTQLTSLNTSGVSYKSPTIAVKSNNLPVIISTYDNDNLALTKQITCHYYNGSSWSTSLVYNVTDYEQGSASVAIDSNDYIHVSWYGVDSASSTNNIRYAKSTDGGTTWSASQKLTSSTNGDQIEPSITIDFANKIRIFWMGASGTINNLKMIESTDGGSTWSSIVSRTSNASGTVLLQGVSALWSKFNMNSADAVRWIYREDSTVKYDSFTLNTAPTAPSGLTRASYDAIEAADFTWTFGDPDAGNTQSAYQLLIKRVSDGTTIVDSGKVVSTSSSRTVAAGTLTNGVQYQWQVRTWDNSDAVGPYSALATFYASAKPIATITTPATDGASVTTSDISVEWSFSDPESEGQSSYQLTLTNSTDTVLWDSGKVTDTVARNRTVGYALSNLTSYKVKLIVWDAKDVASTLVVRTFTTAYNAPIIPLISATSESANGRVVITVNNDNYPKTNFVGKLTGSTVENPHILKAAAGASLVTPSGSAVEVSQTAYDSVATLNGTGYNRFSGTSGNIAQHLFSFNLIEHVIRNYGTSVFGAATTVADRVTWLKANLTRMTLNWSGYGSGPTGNKAKLAWWTGSWTTATGTPWEHTSSAITKLSPFTLNGSTAWFSSAIDSNGFTHMIAYAPEASNGTISSSIVTDFVELEITVKPAVLYNDIYRRPTGSSTWMRVATNVTVSGSYSDYTAASGTSYDYKAVAIGENGTSTDSTVALAQLSLSGVWLHVVDDLSSAYNFLWDGGGRSSSWKADNTMLQFAGRSKQVAEFGESEEGKVTAKLDLREGDQDYQSLDSLVRRKGIVCYRDARGRKLFGVIQELPIDDQQWGYTTTIEVNEVAFEEAV